VNFDRKNSTHMDTFLNEIAPIFRGDSRFALEFHPVGKWGGPNDTRLEICDGDSVEDVSRTLTEKALAAGFPNSPLKKSLMSHSSACYAGKETSIVVGSDGTIYKCTVAFTDPRNKVGKLTKDGELVIDEERWNLWTKVSDKDATKCTTCSFSPSCQSRACPLVAIQENQPPCPFTQTGYVSAVKLIVNSEMSAAQ